MGRWHGGFWRCRGVGEGVIQRGTSERLAELDCVRPWQRREAFMAVRRGLIRGRGSTCL